MPGRKRTPAAKRELEGNPGIRPIPEEPPTKTVESYVPPPKELKGDALDTWKTMLPILIEMGVLAQSDLKSFKQYCIVCGMAHDAYEDIKEKGLIIDHVNTNGDHIRKKNPSADLLKEMTAQARIFAAEFGLTPASRSKAGYSKPPVESNQIKKNKFTH